VQANYNQPKGVTLLWSRLNLCLWGLNSKFRISEKRRYLGKDFEERRSVQIRDQEQLLPVVFRQTLRPQPCKLRLRRELICYVCWRLSFKSQNWSHKRDWRQRAWSKI